MKTFDKLNALLKRLPGIGPRQAERLSAYFMRASNAYIEEFISAIKRLKYSVKLCRRCFAWSETQLCPICSDDSRNETLLCIVEESKDIEAIEKTRTFDGYYHVLGGVISHIDGVGTDKIRANELIETIKKSPVKIKEVIIALDPDTEGEATAVYLAEVLRNIVPKITRIAYGVPLGGDLDYTDEMTLTYALKGRTDI